jgi:GR25 family glycosyltransferase involved in LPS biosynthesis
MKTYVINLDIYPEKYKNIKKQLGKNDIYPERYSAVYGKDLDKKFINEITDPSVTYTIRTERSLDSQFQSINGVGCYLSHVNLWKMLIQDDKNDTYLIFEDDCYIDEHSMKNVNKFLEQFNRSKEKNIEWDFIFLGFSKPLATEKDLKISDNLYQIKCQTFGTHAYIINRNGAKKLLKNAFPIVHQVDSYISYMASDRDLKAYRPNTSLLNQKNDKSSIQTDNYENIKIILNRYDNKKIMKIMKITIFIMVFLLILLILLICKKR